MEYNFLFIRGGWYHHCLESMNPYIIISSAIVLAALILWWDVKADFKYWKQKKDINHSNQGFKRLMLLTPSIIMLAIPITWVSTKLLAIVAVIILCVLISFGVIGFWYWLLFDGLYSNKRRYNFWNLGSDGPEDGKTDNFLQSLTKSQHIAVKIGGCLIFTTAYVILCIWK